MERVTILYKVVPAHRVFDLDGVKTPVFHFCDSTVEGMLAQEGKGLVCRCGRWPRVSLRVELVCRRGHLFAGLQYRVALVYLSFTADALRDHPFHVMLHDFRVIDAVVERVPVRGEIHLKVNREVTLR